MWKLLLSKAAISFYIVFLANPYLWGQTFTKVDDASNPIVADAGPTGYTGASWIDFNNDGNLDLFVGNNRLYRNDGGGQFVKLTTAIGEGQNLTIGNGNTWADYDNDGDLDVYVSSANSFLYRNDGNETFTKIETGEIGDGSANRGWSCAWADYNNDGFVDLVITHPAGFIPPFNNPTNNHLYQNSGSPNFTLARITTEPIVTGSLTAYTVGTWSDFDLDGDMDYFIGAGLANGMTQADFLFRNQLVETGSANFERITAAPIGTDLQDGQVWNWIDYDNDGDLDAYLTNWGGANGSGIANRLYRNDSGTFTRITGQPIADDVNISLSSVWGDMDNDGDLDCFVANDSNQPDRYYRNNGDGTFTNVTNSGITESLTHRGASAGDYDNDGDLDLIAVGPGAAFALYRNDTQNSNGWLNIKCVGTSSNGAAIGTKVRAKAVINGAPIWQMREVSAQNNFNGQNSLRVHFGLGDATIIDSLIIEWPAGAVEMFSNIGINNFYEAIEEQSFTEAPITSVEETHSISIPKFFKLYENYPNPFNPETQITYELAANGKVVLNIYNLVGQKVRTLVNSSEGPGIKKVTWDGRNNAGQRVPSGLYIYQIQAGAFIESKKMVLLR